MNDTVNIIALTHAIEGTTPAPVSGEWMFSEQDDASEYFDLPSNVLWSVLDSKDGEWGPVYFIVNGDCGKWVAADLLERY